MDALLRERLRTVREKRGMTQEQLASEMGLGDRQALSQIEGGGRQLSAEELTKAARALGTTVFALTDPFQLMGEGQFSWRQKNVSDVDLDAFEAKAGRWIAAFRHLSALKGEPVNSALRRLGLTERSTYEDAWAAGEAVGKLLDLGEIPAQRLVHALQDQFDTLVLYVDASPGISGAACQLGALNAILVNRKEPLGRRNYDLAHEFFHLLTWDTMPPRRRDMAESKGKDSYKRIEELAENFAASLLMPRRIIRQIVERNPIPKVARVPWICEAASYMLVSPTAMLWRLVALGYLTKSAAESLKASGLLGDANCLVQESPPAFSQKLVEVVRWGIDCGQLSARRAAALFDRSLEELKSLFESHGIPCPYEL